MRLEGRVAVSKGAAPDRGNMPAPTPVEIAAGEQVTVAVKTALLPRHADLVASTAWIQQQLVFESTPLAEVAEEFNRFNTRRLVVEGEALGNLHVSGTFPALDPASLPRFVRFLREQPGIDVRESDDRIVVTQK